MLLKITGTVQGGIYILPPNLKIQVRMHGATDRKINKPAANLTDFAPKK